MHWIHGAGQFTEAAQAGRGVNSPRNEGDLADERMPNMVEPLDDADTFQPRALAGRVAKMPTATVADLAAVLPLAARLYVTLVPGEHRGDAYFPAVDWLAWKLLRERKSEGVGESSCLFRVYERAATERSGS